MTSSVGGTGAGYGILNLLIANNATVRHQLDTLTEQVSTGLISQTYAGLGPRAEISLNLNPQLKALKTYQDNISQAAGAMQVTQSAMTQIQQIAATFVSAIPNLNALSVSEVDSVASNARQALQQVANLLDSKDGDNYVFAGQDSANAPVPAPSSILSSGFYQQIKAAVTAMSSSGAAATSQATLAIAGSNAPGTSPFSAYMSQPAISAPIVQTGEDSTAQIGLLAATNSVGISPGANSIPPTSTGSYMRDLMRALATLGSLSSSQVNDPSFDALVQDTGASLTDVVGTMAIDVGVLGNTQASLSATQKQLSSTATALSAQLSPVQDVDLAATISRLTSMQTQLQASYRLIAEANSLSLVNFLPAA